MVLAILQFDVLVHDATSLKDKRRVVVSLKDRLHREHRAAIGEVGFQESLNASRLALVLVGTDAKHLGQTLDQITAKLRESGAHMGFELGDTSREFLRSSSPAGLVLEGDERGDAELARALMERGAEVSADVGEKGATR